MFTGIVEELGTVLALEHPDGTEADAVLRVQGPLVATDARLGDSICVNGVCLTVTAVEGDEFGADVMPESLRVTTLGTLRHGVQVNLERALLPSSRLGGHIVQGHTDGTAKLLQRTPGPRWDVLRFELPPDLAPLVVNKGSIAVDGVSLTVSAVSSAVSAASGTVGSRDAAWFEVSLIPTTLAVTTLGTLEVGAAVNLETDIFAKHVARLWEMGRSDDEGEGR